MVDRVLMLYGGKNCCLCEEAKAAAARVLPLFGLSYSYANVREDPELNAKYGDMIPVFCCGGQILAAGRITDAELAAALEAAGFSRVVAVKPGTRQGSSGILG